MTAKTQAKAKRLAYSVTEVAEMVGISTATVNAMIKDGELPSASLVGRRLIHWTAVDGLLGGALSANGDRQADDSECLTLTVAEVAEITPLSLATVNARLADGTIPSLRIPGRRRRLVRRDVLDAVLRGETPVGGDAA